MKIVNIGLISVKRVWRDPTSLFFMLLLPVVITLIIGVAIFDAGSRLSVGLVANGEGPLAAELVRELETTDTFTITRYDSAEALRAAIRRDTESAGVVIPRGYDAALRRGETSSVTLVVNPTRNAPAAVRETVAAMVADQAALVQAAQFSTANTGGTFEQNLERARSLDSRQTGRLSVKAQATERSDDELPSGFGYTAPANLVLFVFITSMAGAGILIETRTLGISRRMLGTPSSAGTILAGETFGRFLIAFTQGLLIFGAGALLFGVDWGDPVAAFLLVLMVSFVGTALALLVGTLFRTPEQAQAVGPPLGIGLGMLSGCMWPLEIVSPTMRSLGHLFPQAWAMDGFIKLIARGAHLGDIAIELAVLAGFGMLLMVVATSRLRRALVT